MSEKYNRSYVFMPWDDETTINYQNHNGDVVESTRWSVIKQRLSVHIDSIDHLIEAIRSYNVYCDTDGVQVTPAWSFRSLRDTFESIGPDKKDEFFKEDGVLDSIRSLTLSSPKNCPDVPWLGTGAESNLKLHQMQVACILSNAFLCTFPRRCRNQPSINFNTLFEGSKASSSCRAKEKLKCILNYFFRIHEKQPCGYVSFHRRIIEPDKFPRWNNTTVPLTSLNAVSAGRIEDQPGHLQVDFANRVIGGGVLGWGCVQEEIRFVINPELIAARLFTEPFAENEALIAIGVERFSNYTGYADSFTFAGDHIDQTPLDDKQMRQTQILAVDALRFGRHADDQFRESRILREVKKMYVGLRPLSREHPLLPVATGNWGCGVYNGDPQLKSLIQLMAASQAGRNVTYFTFGDEALKDDLMKMQEILKRSSVTVGQLYRILTRYLKDRGRRQNVFQFVSGSLTARENMRHFFSSEEPVVSEGGQKRRWINASSSWSGNSSLPPKKTTASFAWTESERGKTDSELSRHFTNSLHTKVPVAVTSDTSSRISPSEFLDSQEPDQNELLEHDSASSDFIPCTPMEEREVSRPVERKSLLESMYGTPSKETRTHVVTEYFHKIGQASNGQCDTLTQKASNTVGSTYIQPSPENKMPETVGQSSTQPRTKLLDLKEGCENIAHTRDRDSLERSPPSSSSDCFIGDSRPICDDSEDFIPETPKKDVNGERSPYFKQTDSAQSKRYAQCKINDFFKKT